MKYFLSKAFVLLLVFILVQIPLHWTDDINNERLSFKHDAVTTVSNSYAGHQVVSGPVLVFPYTHHYWEDVRNKDGNPVGREERTRTGVVSLLPGQLQLDNDVTVEQRRIGIFPVPVFRATVDMQADFSWEALPNPEPLKPEDRLEWGQPYLALPVSDQHGIKQVEHIRWNDDNLAYAPGSRVSLYGGQGVHAMVPAGPAGGTGKAVARIGVIGTEMLHNLPGAGQTRISMKSNWPHPQFGGAQLPDVREIAQSGFTASWQSSALATNVNTLWQQCATGNHCDALAAESLGVQMMDPTNFYATMSRALKYGFLFLSISFIAFVLFEVMCDLRIHPVQYSLLGVACGIFFLLLLSMAEHLGFALAYGVAAAACLLLLTLYARALLKVWSRTLGFSAVLASLYAVLFIILQQEDAALLAGSLLLFVLLAVAMMVTRNIDWYAWQEKFARPARNAEA